MTVAGSTFRTDEPFLQELLQMVNLGQIQLPDFQRGWVWDDDHIRALIASVSLSYPIGAVMLVEAGGESARFLPKLVEGVELPEPYPFPDKLILDGQQRLTSLYLSFRSSKPVPTRTEKGEEIERVYFLDMKACLDLEADRLDAVVSLPPDKIVRSDFGRKVELDVSTREKEYQHTLFPLSLMYDPTAYTEWKIGFQEYYHFNQDDLRFLNGFDQEIWLRFQQYKVPVIVLLRHTPKEAICQVFEKVNTGGVSLSVFELVTATFAADDFPLRNDWDTRSARLHSNLVLEGMDATAFLTTVTLFATYLQHLQHGNPVSCKRKDVLKLSLSDYRKYADKIEKGFMAAARFLAREKIYDTKALPYSSQLIPLSATCAALGSKFDEEPVKRKVARWLWSGVFGELYGGANETRFALDLPEVVQWIQGGGEPRTVRDANFTPIRLLSLQSRLSAAYKGVMALLIQEGSRDFLSGDQIDLTRYFDLAVDIHHIFPKAYCESRIPRLRWNSVINKAPLTAKTNRTIGGRSPKSYLANFEKHHELTNDQQNEILESHLINPSHLREDDFDTFFIDRASKLLNLIEKAIGKTISGRDSEEVISNFGSSLISRS
jgi:hypothetical protein